MIVEQCDTVRVEFETDEGAWTATMDLAAQQVAFLNKSNRRSPPAARTP
ncbi:hypothetical protein ACFQ1B_02400 [Streptomyces mexicanus]